MGRDGRSAALLRTRASGPGASVIVRATANEAPGAGLVVAGLTVIERVVRQRLHAGQTVVVASDGSCHLAGLPDAVEIRSIDRPSAVGTLALSRGARDVMPADRVHPATQPCGPAIRVTDEPSRRFAEDAVFAVLLRADLGLVARTLNKPISFFITRHILCRLPVTPNQVTLCGAAIGLGGCALVATGRHSLVVAGLLLLHFQSILDGCDGELARVRFQATTAGGWLDTVADDLLNLTATLAMGAALARSENSPVPFILGLVGCALFLTFNLSSYRELVRHGDGGCALAVRWWFTRGADLRRLHSRQGSPRIIFALTRRDFFVLAWAILAAMGLLWLAFAYALLVAAGSFVVAVGQAVARRPGARA